MSELLAEPYVYMAAEDWRASANQQPGRYNDELFSQWTREGWEIVSVTVCPTLNQSSPFKVVGIVRKARHALSGVSTRE